jgi:hypothetical protein
MAVFDEVEGIGENSIRGFFFRASSGNPLGGIDKKTRGISV